MNKKIIMDYISNLLKEDKQISDFDDFYRPISKEYVLRDIIKRFNLKYSTAYLYCSFFEFKR
tara:strand:+ start:374 stop:559 length:186 start_codon:yes stop_codon:yes gene_type:complete